MEGPHIESAARPSTATWSGPTRVDMRARAPRGTRPSAPRRERLGCYEVECQLGEGGMAAVFLARHAVIDRAVAIKRLAPELAHLPEAHALFLREARIAGAVRHPGVVEVFDFGYDAQGRPYFVMELARGTAIKWHTLACADTVRGRRCESRSRCCSAAETDRSRGRARAARRPSSRGQVGAA